MTTKRITIRPTPGLVSWLETSFKNRSGGAEWLTEWGMCAMRQALVGLRGRFTTGELLAVIDLTNSLFLAPGQTGPHYLALMLHDGCDLEGMADKWGIDRDAAVAKAEALTPLESAALLVWAKAYWSAGHYERASPEEYVRALVG